MANRKPLKLQDDVTICLHLVQIPWIHLRRCVKLVFCTLSNVLRIENYFGSCPFRRWRDLVIVVKLVTQEVLLQ